MDGLQGFVAYTEKNKPYVVMIFIQFVYAGMSLLSKAAITEGMNPHVFVVYRQALATLALAPFAFFLERFHYKIVDFICFFMHFIVNFLTKNLCNFSC